jgi:hypothetical protein
MPVGGAVSQRVPRDAYRRIAKTDVLGKYAASWEKRCRVSAESGKRSSALRSSKVRKALEDDYEKRTYLRNLNRSGLGSAAAKLPPHGPAW